jgi:hypothetical protein
MKLKRGAYAPLRRPVRGTKDTEIILLGGYALLLSILLVDDKGVRFEHQSWRLVDIRYC